MALLPMDPDSRNPFDRLIGEFDRALRAVAGVGTAARPSPGQATPEAELDAAERAHAAALMRVNHVGEVCAQALYQGQALTARDVHAKAALEQAAREEEDHLAWSAERIRALGGRWNLAFLAETERQVEEHLDGHLERLPRADERTRAVVEAMRVDEAKH